MLIYLIIILLIVITIYLFLLFPRLSKKTEFEKYKDYYYAHRGLFDNQLYAENSLEAFKQAIDSGYGIELDVQLTKDLQVVVFHDYNLVRACRIDNFVNKLTYQELRELSLFGTEQKIPLLSEVLTLVNGQVPLIVEFKQRSTNDRCAYLASEVLDTYSGPFVVESFNPFAIQWIKKNRPNWIRGQLSCKYYGNSGTTRVAELILQFLLTNIITRPDFIAYDIENYHNLSFQICAKLFKSATVLWTLESQEQLDKVKSNYDLFIFEHFKAK